MNCEEYDKIFLSLDYLNHIVTLLEDNKEKCYLYGKIIMIKNELENQIDDMS